VDFFGDFPGSFGFLAAPAGVQQQPSVLGRGTSQFCDKVFGHGFEEASNSFVPVQNSLEAVLFPASSVANNGAAGEGKDDAVERVKKRRRESAQRSRARKNAYLRSLEVRCKLVGAWANWSWGRVLKSKTLSLGRFGGT
jgi:hypothetical protein